MFTNARISPNQAHQVQPDVRTSRIRALRILGGLQISLGVVCGILGIVGAILSNTEMDSRCKNFDYYTYDRYSHIVIGYSYYHCGEANAILIMDLIGMAFSGWTIAFLVCNIISAVVFSSTVFGLAVVGAIIAVFDTNTGSVIAVSAFLAVFSFIEFIISIVAASHCCCCSQLNTGNQQGVIFMNTSGVMYNMPNTQIPTGNQQGYHQMWMPQMQGYYGQQPANMPNYRQQAGHSQGNQMPLQAHYGQQPQSFEMANQQQNINAQQFVHPTAPAEDKHQPVPVADNCIRSEM